jgi:hypothetical protein
MVMSSAEIFRETDCIIEFQQQSNLQRRGPRLNEGKSLKIISGEEEKLVEFQR